MAVDVDYIGILNYLEENRETPYSYNAEDTSHMTDEEHAQLSSMEEKGMWVEKELRKIGELCNEEYGLDKAKPCSWLNGSKTNSQKYLWLQMQYSRYSDNPAGILVYVEYNEDRGVEYRICLDVRKDVIDQKTREKFHSYIDLPINKGDGLTFTYGSNKWGGPNILNDSQEGVRERIKNGEFRKVQLSKYIENSEDEDNEYYEGEIIDAIGQLLPYYKYVIGADEEDELMEESQAMSEDRALGVNTILYGPPGTGKTYNTVKYAVSICDGVSIDTLSDYDAAMERFNKLKEEGRIAFTTFHQSYGYEEFIEGIKPKLNSESKEVGYSIEDGVFKDFCDKARKVKVQASGKSLIKEQPRIWGMILGSTGPNKIKAQCFTEGVIRLGWDEVKDEDIEGDYVGDESSSWNGKHMVDDFKNNMEIGDIVVIEKSNKSIDAVGAIISEYYYDENASSYARYRKVEWLAKGIDQDMVPYLKVKGRKQMARFSLFSFDYIGMGAISEILEKNSDASLKVEKETKPYVFIIDEINRGNISKIFGELITLIENTKRENEPEAASAILPYSGDLFSVPNNVYILGTMNTADRSIALMDTALRRRFDFVEMMPDASALRGIKVTADGESVDVAELLQTINQRIEYLYDREHTIGHAFFIKLKNNPSLDVLATIFKNNVIPLLQEYFYEDYEKIQLVLGDNKKSSSEYQFIKDEAPDIRSVFKGTPNVEKLDLIEKRYRIQKSAYYHIQSYKEIGDAI